MSKVNKDGTLRKSGSGRTKGATSLVSVKLSTLKEKFSDEDVIVCGRVFLREAGIEPSGKAISAPLSDEEKAGITLTEG